MEKQTFGVIVTTRSFFPSHLVKTAREQITRKLEELGYGWVMVSEQDTQHGAVLTFDEAKTCAALFKAHRDEICGIICVLPNFGEELGVAEAIDLAGLDVPVLVQACDDDFDKLDMANRRDAFCGKISLCNNLYQRGIPFTDTTLHTCAIDSPEFTADLKKFAAVCRVVGGLRGARIAMLGARPVAFNTVRYSEKILQAHKIAVQTVDMSEIIFAAQNYPDGEKVRAKEAEIRAYGKIPAHIEDFKVTKQAKLCLAIEEYVDALQCQASTAPALMDWNNHIREDRDSCISLHCTNFPKSFFQNPEMEIECLDVLGSTLGQDKCFGACKAQVAPGPMTFVRLTTDDTRGVMKMYVGEGEFGAEPIPTKGGVANCRVPHLQQLMKYICKNGYEHHVCFVRGHVADVLAEALSTYLGVEVYRHA